MRVAVDVTGFGRYAEPAVVADVARAAEEGGWDGIFLWDHIGWAQGIPCGDPWISLTAAACATSRIRLGTSVTPLPRRRPHVVATAAAALDRLSAGRFVLGAGIGGVAAEYEAFGEEAEAKVRAEKLDEALDLIARLWSGERVDHDGPHYRAAGVTLAPSTAQRPRPPIWVGGDSRAALRRAARWDGWTVGVVDERGVTTVAADVVAERVDAIGRGDGFDVAVVGWSEPGGHDQRRPYEQAGATWWLESVHDLRGPLHGMLERVALGP